MKIREQTEWCRYYWYETQDMKLPRVLLVGDSIVAAYNGEVAKRLEGIATVAFFSTSACVGDPAIYRQLNLAFAGYQYELVHFNNGLHGFTTTESDYAKGLSDFVDAIDELAPSAQHIWRSSTPITIKDDPATLEPEKNPRVIERNKLAASIMTQRQIQIDDLYNVAVNYPELSCGDGYHYNEQGNTVLADHVAKVIADALI